MLLIISNNDRSSSNRIYCVIVDFFKCLNFSPEIFSFNLYVKAKGLNHAHQKQYKSFDIEIT